MKNLVSIVLPTHNRRMLLAEAIGSCLQQTYPLIEVVVVDDGSSDGTEEYVRGLQDERIVYFKLSPGQGMVAAFNAGLSRARGAYLTLLSDDDLYVPEAVAVLADELDRDPAVDFVYAHYDNIDAQGRFLSSGRVEDPEGLDKDNYIGHCHLYRRKVFDELGGYCAAPVLVEDYEHWLRVRAKFRMKRMAQVLFHHRMHPESLTMVHGPCKVALAVEKVRRPYIPAWKHHFFLAERHYHAPSRWPGLGHVLLSLALGPCHVLSWRLLALLLLPAPVIQFIRKCRGARCAG